MRDERLVVPIRSTLGRLGISVSPDDASMVLRGMETLGVRMQHSRAVAMSLIGRLQAAEVVERILYPALSTDPGYPIWQRDFTGASAVFSIIFKSGMADHVPPPPPRHWMSLGLLRSGRRGAARAASLLPCRSEPTDQLRNGPGTT